MRPLYMETTKKETEEKSAEIASMLKNYGLTKYMHDYEDGEIIGCVFGIRIDDKNVPIKLPVRWEALWIMAQNGQTRYIKDEAQARRVAWRQVHRWIQAQLAMVDTGSVEMAEIFLPYMIVKGNKTLYEHMTDNDMKLIEGRIE